MVRMSLKSDFGLEQGSNVDKVMRSLFLWFCCECKFSIEKKNTNTILCHKYVDIKPIKVDTKIIIAYFYCTIIHCIFWFSDVDDAEFRPPEAELDEHHPKATRTLFVGNLEKEITMEELKDMFSKYGEILVC